MRSGYDLAKPILATDADNAFLPLLQAINCLYLSKWKESAELAKAGLENENLWPEDYAVLCAVMAAALGAQKKRWSAGRHFARSFWAKPLRPDVIVLGSRMVYRDQLPFRLFPPVDWGLQRFVRRRRFPPFNSLYLVQLKVVVRVPCNFDMVLVDWSELALDQKAKTPVFSSPRPSGHSVAESLEQSNDMYQLMTPVRQVALRRHVTDHIWASLSRSGCHRHHAGSIRFSEAQITHLYL